MAWGVWRGCVAWGVGCRVCGVCGEYIEIVDRKCGMFRESGVFSGSGSIWVAWRRNIRFDEMSRLKGKYITFLTILRTQVNNCFSLDNLSF